MASMKGAEIRRVTAGYLQAILDRQDPTPYTQISARGRHVHELPVFTQFEIEDVMPITGRSSSEVQMGAVVRLLFSAGGGLGMTWIRARFSLVCEDETGAPSATGKWGVCPSSYRPLADKA